MKENQNNEQLEIKLSLPLPTSINALYINQFKYNPYTRKREMTGAKILSKAGAQRKKEIQDQASEQLKSQLWDYEWTKTNYVYQDAVIYFGRKGSDDNNIYKLLNDSLEGIIYDNDSRVLVRTQRVVYDSVNPHVELVITPVEFVGIFEDKHKSETFIEHCTTCTRYLNGRCSILKDSLDGYVRAEIGDIDDAQCNKYKEKNKK